MLNGIFIVLMVGSVLAGAYLGKIGDVSAASIDSAKVAVNIAISLIGQMALWLGMMKILEDAGLLKSAARALRPIMTRLFPDVPEDHPAMSAMILNIAANMIGLTNAATPFGLRAMVELNKLNKHKGVATNSMCLFLAINTSGVAVLPLGAIATRAALGAANVTGIVVPSILATMCSTVVGVLVATMLVRLPFFAVEKYVDEVGTTPEDEVPAAIKGMESAEASADRPTPPFSKWRLVVSVLVVALVGGLMVQKGVESPKNSLGFLKDVLEGWLLPLIMMAFVLFGFAKSVKVYESLVSGAKEGFNIAVMIIPFMVAILVPIGMFRASGAMDLLVQAITPITSLIGFPAEALPMALIRPLSGSGAYAVMTETMKAYGPDSFVGYLVCVMNGSTETTFYVLAVYFGAVQVRASRHAVFACLSADFVGVFAALMLARLFF